jgi:5-methylcytosine-specific restriction endonuclease McrA
MADIDWKSLLRHSPKQEVKNRVVFPAKLRQEVFAKTGGNCHMCGEALQFESYGGSRKTRKSPHGRWQVDHVVPLIVGGSHDIENLLPICRPCNRARWHYDGKRLRLLLQLGTIAFREIKRETDLGLELKKKFSSDEKSRVARRTSSRR